MARKAMSDAEPSCKGKGRQHLCVLVHGMGGDCHDWDTWLEVLGERFPSWHLRPLKGLAKGTRFLGASVDQLAELAAQEIVEIIRSEQKSSPRRLILHCIGHSMGGLILRGALPKVFEELGGSELESSENQTGSGSGTGTSRASVSGSSSELPLTLGHYLSLSSPHLGIQTSWQAPLLLWKNLCWLTHFITGQLAQLALQDTGPFQVPYLLSISRPSGPHMTLLQEFCVRTCVTLASADPLIPVSSGIIDPNPKIATHSILDAPFWRFDHQPAQEPVLAQSESQEEIVGLALESGPDHGLGLGQKNLGWHWRWGWVCRQALRRLTVWLLELLHACIAPLGGKHHLARPGDCSSCESAGEDKDVAQEACGDGEIGEGKESPARTGLSQSRRLSWRTSFDGACRYPCELLDGLCSVPWRRIVTKVHHPPMCRNAHVFLIGKKSEQFALEHSMSRQCIQSLAELLVDATAGRQGHKTSEL